MQYLRGSEIMALKLIDISDDLLRGASFEIDIISEGFILVKVIFNSSEPKKNYSGRCSWRYYGEAEPLTFYFQKRIDVGSKLKVLTPSELTFFVDAFHSEQSKYKQNSVVNRLGIPLFEIIEATEMSNGLSFEESGGFTVEYKEEHIICYLNHLIIDEIIHVSDLVNVLLCEGCFAGIKLKLNDYQKSKLYESALILV